MTPSYSVSADIVRSLLRLTPSGFFDLDTVRRFTAERNAAVDRMRCGRNRHVTICDLREQMISPPTVAAAFREVIADPRYQSRKLAFVVTAALARVQTQRLVSRDSVAYFSNTVEAEAWLFASADPAPDMAGRMAGAADQRR